MELENNPTINPDFRTELITHAANYVQQLLAILLDSGRHFHGLAHTRRVVENCKKLAFLESLSARDTELLIIAAWFHDAGYLRGSKNHENESTDIALSFFESIEPRRSTDFKIIKKIILSTCLSNAPSTILEKIIRDADLSHLGSEDYWNWEKRLRQELLEADGINMTDAAWYARNLQFFEDNDYFTVHGRALWSAQKEKNYAVLKSLTNEASE